jgi:hypothetical protein
LPSQTGVKTWAVFAVVSHTEIRLALGSATNTVFPSTVKPLGAFI